MKVRVGEQGRIRLEYYTSRPKYLIAFLLTTAAIVILGLNFIVPIAERSLLSLFTISGLLPILGILILTAGDLQFLITLIRHDVKLTADVTGLHVNFYGYHTIEWKHIENVYFMRYGLLGSSLLIVFGSNPGLTYPTILNTIVARFLQPNQNRILYVSDLTTERSAREIASKLREVYLN